MTIPRIAWAAYAFAAAVIVLDQITKAWMLYGLHIREVGQIRVLEPIFNLTFVLNRGVSFGLLTGGETGRWLLTVFSIAVAGLLAFWATRADRRLLITAIGLIMGGALGNVIDRIRFGGVVDFLDFSGLYFPWVFNVADSAISIGVVLLIADSFISERSAKVGAAHEKS
ncbi:MAG: signal peptidase II [Brevundimonas sp.]|jgi:signal peptidase II|uniref:signal peptidase II n=1 Tax=Brevundimonas sp. TaxID=1871086 RepID=UPI0039E59CF2